MENMQYRPVARIFNGGGGGGGLRTVGARVRACKEDGGSGEIGPRKIVKVRLSERACIVRFEGSLTSNQAAKSLCKNMTFN